MTIKQSDLLSALGRYTFLSRRQIAKLGIEKYNSNITKVVDVLVEKKLIGVLNARKFGLGYVYYLRKPGADILADHSMESNSNIKYCKSTPTLTSQTLYHRTYAIDFQIELDIQAQFLGYEVGEYLREIERSGRLERATRFSGKNCFIEPDALFKLHTEKGTKLFCFELENRSYTKKSLEKISNHIDALNMKSASTKMNHSKAYRILMVYINPSTMYSVMDKLSQMKETKNWILFKSFEDVVTGVKRDRNVFIIGKYKTKVENNKIEDPIHRFVSCEVDPLEKVDPITQNWLNAKGEPVDLF